MIKKEMLSDLPENRAAIGRHLLGKILKNTQLRNWFMEHFAELSGNLV
jgi:hypothetical protein